MGSRTKETELFERTPVFKAILNLAVPSIIGQIILVIYNIADTFFVGLTNSDEMITAVTVCMPAFMFLSAISNLFGVGGASVISRLLGVKDQENARHASRFTLWGCVCVTVLYALGVWLFMDGFVNLLGGSDQSVHGHACAYMIYAVVIGGVATSVNTLFSHLIRAEGHALKASTGIMIGGIANIVLDPLFMFVILPKGNEAVGAAMATMLSNFVALFYFVIVIAKNRSSLVLSVRPKKAMFLSGIPKSVVAAGIPACAMTLCENISYAVLDNILSIAGTPTQAGIGVAKKVNMLAHCIVRGMAQGVLPLIGYNFASGNRKRMKHTVYISAAMSISLSIVCMTCCLLLSCPLISIFLKEGGESHKNGIVFLRILCVGAPFSALAYTVISFFQATGHTMKSLVLALMRKGILDIPLMFILSEIVPVKGTIAATPLADMICCAAAIAMFVSFIRQHGDNREPVENASAIASAKA